MNSRVAIILCGGQINYTNLPIATNASNSMIPVHGKPVIGWIIDDLIDKQFQDVVVVLQETNIKLKEYLSWAYNGRIDFTFAFTSERSTILHSLIAGLDRVQSNSIHLLLGDTLIKDSFQDGDGNLVYVGNIADHHKWCMVRLNDQHVISEYFEKPKEVIIGTKALCGYYKFSNVPLLKRCVQDALLSKEAQLSSALKFYGKEEPILAKDVERWYDFGNLENFISSKLKLFRSRHFNSIQIDGLLGVLVKRSKANEKLLDELRWYSELPNELKVLAPRYFNQPSGEGVVEIVQEYYGYPNLAELYLYSDFDIDIWYSIIDKLFEVHSLFKSHHAVSKPEVLADMYIHKTLDRLKHHELGPISDILSEENLLINGHARKNFSLLLSNIVEKVNLMQRQWSVSSIIHGDFCFSNILFDINNGLVRVIDPRGSFGKKGIYGDPRYDIAKLRHSVVGLYDYITSDLFSATLINHAIDYSILANDNVDKLSSYLDRAIVEAGYDLNEIKLIEGLLFISMVPLHSDYPSRQLVMFAKGIDLLNEVFI